MQEKLKETLKKISIFTTDPDKDWRRLFGALLVLTVIAFVWSIFFYIEVNQAIVSSESTERKTVDGVTTEREDELHKLITEFEAKKQKNDDVLKGTRRPALLDLSDPAR